MPEALGAHGMTPADVYFRAEDTGADFGDVLRRAMARSNRMQMASPRDLNKLDRFGGLLRRAA